MNKHRTAIQLIVLILLTGSAAMAGTGRIEIRLLSQSELSGPAVRLSDVAQIRAESETEQEKLGGIEVAKISENIRQGRIGQSDVIQGLTQAGYRPAQIDIFGSASCSFSLKGNEPAAELSPVQNAADLTSNAADGSEGIEAPPQAGINPDAGGETLRSHLTALVSQATGYPVESLFVEWRCRKEGILDEPWSEGRGEIRPTGAISLGSVQFSIRENGSEKIEEKTSRGKNAELAVNGMAYYVYRCLAAVRTMRPGEVIGKQDVKWVGRKADSVQDAGIRNLSEAEGQEVLSTIRAEQILLPRMIRKLQLVKRNDRVDVISRVGSVAVSMQGIARNSGGLGDEILIGQEHRKQILHGRIIGPGKVTVDGESGTPAPLQVQESVVNAK